MHRNTTSAAAIVGTLVLALNLGAGPALAMPVQPPPSDEPSVSIQQSEIDDLDLDLAIGESVEVVEMDGTTTYYQVSAACTEAVTAFNPAVWSGGAYGVVRSQVRFERSSGCSGSVSRTSGLSAKWGIFNIYYGRGSTSGSIGAGQSITLSINFNCLNKNKTTWRSMGYLGYQGNATYSQEVLLACGA